MASLLHLFFAVLLTGSWADAFIWNKSEVTYHDNTLSVRNSKGVWNFQWNFFNGGNPGVEDGNVDPSPPSEMTCPTTEGCVNSAHCFDFGNSEHECDPISEPDAVCYGQNLPDGCTKDPTIMDCACEALPECHHTVLGCSDYNNCFEGSNGKVQCNSQAEPNTLCYSMFNPPLGCRLNPNIPYCACETKSQDIPCPTVVGCVDQANCNVNGVCDARAESNVMCYDFPNLPQGCLPDTTIPQCLCLA